MAKKRVVKVEPELAPMRVVYKVLRGTLVVEEMEKSRVRSRGLENMPIRTPLVRIMNPLDRALVRDITVVTVQVAFPSEVAKVELRLNDAPYGTGVVPKGDTVLFQLDTRALITGRTYLLTAVVFNHTGETITSPSIAVQVDN